METIKYKLIHWGASILLGFVATLETAISFFVPCLLAILLDVLSAYFLGRRLHAKFPDKYDGKFKSEYKFRIIYTMIIVFIAIILAAYVDTLLFHEGDTAVRFVMSVFLFYEAWSCLENWSTENQSPIAKALQRIMVSKAERHLNIPLSDILIEGQSDEQPQSEPGVPTHLQSPTPAQQQYDED